MTIDQFIQQAREIESKSTEGPWEYKSVYLGGNFFPQQPCHVTLTQPGEITRDNERTIYVPVMSDADFVSHAKNTYKPLLDAFEEAVKGLEDLRLEPWPDSHLFARDALAKIQNILEGAGE